jgi:hypothetical protein
MHSINNQTSSNIRSEPVVNSRTFREFIGAYEVNTGAVYVGHGNSISTLPDDLILDEALAVSKTIIMTNRKTK